MSGAEVAALLIYVWAAFCAMLIAAKVGSRAGFIGPLLVIGSIIMGLLWPVTLLMHLKDIEVIRGES